MHKKRQASKAILASLLFGSLLFSQELNRAQWAISEKEWDGKKYYVTGVLEEADPADCGDVNDTGDLALVWDISDMATKIGDSFDVNNIFIDGVGGFGSKGENALEVWQISFWRKPGLGFNVYTVQSQKSDWSSLKIHACVGGLAQWFTFDSSLEQIALWYDPRGWTDYVVDECDKAPCFDYQEFSNGDLVGWFPAGECAEANYWFQLSKNDNNEFRIVKHLGLSDVCICR